MHPTGPRSRDDDLLTPREVAEIFGVRTTTIARWARAGDLAFQLTPGGHRRYRAETVRAFLKCQGVSIPEERERLEQDAVRLYEQGWSIRQVAEKFDCAYGTMRRILQRRTKIRERW